MKRNTQKKVLSLKNKQKPSASNKSLSLHSKSTRSSVMSSKNLSAKNHSSEFKFSAIQKLDKHITVRYSLSPSKRSIFDRLDQPKEYSSLISFQSIDAKLTQCNPYELKEKKYKKMSSTLIAKNIDLTPGVFSKKQITSESEIRKSMHCPFDVSSSTALTSNTPSPIYNRNTRFSFLSKKFKINKRLFPSQLACNLKELERIKRSEIYETGKPIKITRMNDE